MRTLRPSLTPAFLVIALGISLSLFGTWEMDGETWGYWYFARAYNESGLLAAWDRSPLYVLYLSVFSRFGYPHSVVIEYVISSATFCAAFLSLCYRTRLMVPAAIASVLMLPTIWTSAPNCQVLALACTFLAFAALMSERPSVLRISTAMVFLALAYLFRSTYIAALPIVLAYLFFSEALALESRAKRAGLLALCALPSIVVIAALFGHNHAHQIAHPWNNVFFASTQWFPVNVGSLFDSGFVSHMNWIYIDEKYPGQNGIDFYHTNKELFQGATTAYDAVLANPGFVAHALSQNVVRVFDVMAHLSTLWYPFYKLGLASPGIHLAIGVVLAVAIVFASFARYFRPEYRLMFICLSAIALTSVLSMPKARYFVCIVPVFFFLCIWIVDGINSARGRFRKSNTPVGGFVGTPIGYGAAVCLLFALVSSGTLITMKAASDRIRGGVRILESSVGSKKASFAALSPLAENCRGIVTLEHTFVGAFVAGKNTRVYDVFEVPPFGSFDSTPYAGLNPERVDCLFVSEGLESGVAIGTETFNRYHGYIEPYAESLVQHGGIKVPVPGYGYVVRANR